MATLDADDLLAIKNIFLESMLSASVIAREVWSTELPLDIVSTTNGIFPSASLFPSNTLYPSITSAEIIPSETLYPSGG